jgi:hypothetical protein
MIITNNLFVKYVSPFSKIVFITTLLLQSLNSFSQMNIKGPKCVLAGLVYQYDINAGKQNSIEVCVTGGLLVNSAATCRTQADVSDIKVIWDSTSTNGKLSIKTSSGNITNYDIQITQKLDGGKIDTSTVLQSIDAGKKPREIKCRVAEKGNCGAAFSYQWQKSLDYMKWESLPGATSANLNLSAAPAEPTFYRRVVTETKSGALAYSDVATIVVIPQPPN